MARRRAGNERTPPGRLRIVAGKWRSRLLDVVDLAGLRPTSERVRETLFNWLGPGIEGKRCLDLFAGTGALGLEALSRGAEEVVFVERSHRAVVALRKAAGLLGAGPAAIIEQSDALKYLRSAGPRQLFDIAFLDPPYADDSVAELCRLLAEGGWLTPGARVYFEQDKAAVAPVLPAGWSIVREKLAGQVRFWLASAGRVEEHEGKE